MGVGLFLEFKERIIRDYKPDFLLIDSRTGITEIGGVATTLLADQIICFLINNQENLDGAREVMRSIQRVSPRYHDSKPIDMYPVLTRIPIEEEGNRETEIVAKCHSFLNEQAENLQDTLTLTTPVVLHSEPALEMEESLRLIGVHKSDQSPLLRDYLRLFRVIIPQELIKPQIEILINEVFLKALENPDNAQKELESIVDNYPHPVSLKTLIKFYRLRNVNINEILSKALRLWDESEEESIVWSVVSEWLNIWSDEKRLYAYDRGMISTQFKNIPWLKIIDIWDKAGKSEIKTGLIIQSFCNMLDKHEFSEIIIYKLLNSYADNEEVVNRAVEHFTKSKKYEVAELIIERYKQKFKNTKSFQELWVSLLVAMGDKAKAMALVSEEIIDINNLPTNIHLNFLELLGEDEKIMNRLMGELNNYLNTKNLKQCVRLSAYFDRFGLSNLFEQKIIDVFGDEGKKILEEPGSYWKQRKMRIL